MDELARAEQAATRTSVVLAVFGFADATPLTAAAQRRFCAYAGDALARVPDARAVVVWNEANSPTYWRGDAGAYESLLARCYDVLHRVRPHVVVLDSTASAHDPVAFLRAIGTAYRASGRTRPLVDAFGHNPYPVTSLEPASARHDGDFLGEGDYPRLAATLTSAFAGTPQRSLDVWYLEDGFQTAVPSTSRAPLQRAARPSRRRRRHFRPSASARRSSWRRANRACARSSTSSWSTSRGWRAGSRGSSGAAHGRSRRRHAFADAARSVTHGAVHCADRP